MVCSPAHLHVKILLNLFGLYSLSDSRDVGEKFVFLPEAPWASSPSAPSAGESGDGFQSP